MRKPGFVCSVGVVMRSLCGKSATPCKVRGQALSFVTLGTHYLEIRRDVRIVGTRSTHVQCRIWGRRGSHRDGGCGGVIRAPDVAVASRRGHGFQSSVTCRSPPVILRARERLTRLLPLERRPQSSQNSDSYQPSPSCAGTIGERFRVPVAELQIQAWEVGECHHDRRGLWVLRDESYGRTL